MAAIVVPAPSHAHDPGIREARATFRGDGSFEVDVIMDLDALLVGAPQGSLRQDDYDRLAALPEEEYEALKAALRNYFTRMVRLRFDGEPADFHVAFPDEAPRVNLIWPDANLLGHIARLTGNTPDGAEDFVFSASRAFGDMTLKRSHEGAEPTFDLLRAGEWSPPFSLVAPPPPPPWHRVFGQYLAVGFEHILPKGLDHIFFVLGLFLLGSRMGPLFWQVTAFTVAHSATLALAIYGVVSLPPAIVEPLIALSIVYVAVENLFTRELKPWRPAVVFGFGLLHGLGFAGVLSEWGLPRGQFVTALAAFNIGVELGQIAVIALAFLAVGWYRQRAHYRLRVVIPASSMIALVGLYWAIERAVG